METSDPAGIVRILVDRSVIIVYDGSSAAVIIIGISRLFLRADIAGIFLGQCVGLL
jgi:hypothetical protein